MAGNRKKPQGRVARALERVALGAVMTVVAFVVERRLMNAIRRRGEPQPNNRGRKSEQTDGGLSVSAEEVGQESQGDRSPNASQGHRHPPRHV